MKAIMIRPYNKVEIIELSNVIPECQKLLEGYVEPIYSILPGYVLLVNEEGKLRNLPQNIFGLVGNIIIVKDDGDDFIGLDEKDIERLRGELR